MRKVYLVGIKDSRGFLILRVCISERTAREKFQEKRLEELQYHRNITGNQEMIEILEKTTFDNCEEMIGFADIDMYPALSWESYPLEE